MKRKLDGRYKKNVDTGSMSNQKIDLPLKSYKTLNTPNTKSPDKSEQLRMQKNKFILTYKQRKPKDQ
jgi:hypothetical protein